MAWTDGLSMRVKLHVEEDGRTEAHLHVTNATYEQAAQAIQGAAQVQMIPLVLIFDGDRSAVNMYCQRFGVAIIE